jgi:hypothetical protein
VVFPGYHIRFDGGRRAVSRSVGPLLYPGNHFQRSTCDWADWTVTGKVVRRQCHRIPKLQTFFQDRLPWLLENCYDYLWDCRLGDCVDVCLE